MFILRLHRRGLSAGLSVMTDLSWLEDAPARMQSRTTWLEMKNDGKLNGFLYLRSSSKTVLNG